MKIGTKTGPLYVSVSMVPRWWFRIAFILAYFLCQAKKLDPDRAAEWITKYCMKIKLK